MGKNSVKYESDPKGQSVLVGVDEMRHYGGIDWGSNSQAKSQVTWASVWRIMPYFLPYWKQALLVVICIMMGSVLGLVQPLIVKGIIDTALPQKDTRLLQWLILAMVLAPIAAGLVGVVQNYFNTLIGQRIMFDMRNQVYSHLHKMSLQFFALHKTGDIMSRLNNDVSGLQNVVSETLTNMLNNVIIFCVTLVAMFMLNWQLTALSILILPVFVLPTKRVGRINYAAKKEVQEQLSTLTSVMQETLSISGALQVKAFQRQEWEIERFKRANQAVMEAQIKQRMLGRWFFMIVAVISTAGPALIYWYGGFKVIYGELSIGTVVAFTGFLTRLYGPVSQLANITVNVKGSVALFDRLFEYLDSPVEIVNSPQVKPLPGIKGAIVFHNVVFGYEPGRPILNGVSFSIEPGQLVAVVGPSGAGKSTLSYLIPRFYDPDQGSLTINGIPLKAIDLNDLGKHIGMVTQETFLFHTTVRENLLYGKPDATEAQVIAAAKAANIHDVIARLPLGYDTVVGERGYKFSGGEKQRLAIARVILKNPDLFILDEATSNLDSHSEALIQEALQPLLKTRTSLVIAHRLSTILAADSIIVLDRGRIVETGKHEDLLRAEGLYAQLYHEQFKDLKT